MPRWPLWSQPRWRLIPAGGNTRFLGLYLCPSFMKSLLLMITYRGTLVQHDNGDLEVLLSLTQWLGSQGGGMAENRQRTWWTPPFPWVKGEFESLLPLLLLPDCSLRQSKESKISGSHVTMVSLVPEAELLNVRSPLNSRSKLPGTLLPRVEGQRTRALPGVLLKARPEILLTLTTTCVGAELHTPKVRPPWPAQGPTREEWMGFPTPPLIVFKIDDLQD